MGYHINLYSADKEKAEAFNFDVERFKKDENDFEYWNVFNQKFTEIFKNEFEIGDFLNYSKLEKIESNYGNIYKISKDEFLDIIVQYNEHMFKYYTNFEDKIRLKLEGKMHKDEEDFLLVDIYNLIRTKAWQYSKYTNNLRVEKNDNRLTNNWEFETDIIELVRIYKTTDFDKNVLICVGS